jgi:hypothetical protein
VNSSAAAWPSCSNIIQTAISGSCTMPYRESCDARQEGLDRALKGTTLKEQTAFRSLAYALGQS